jgi:hypothetical protein
MKRKKRPVRIKKHSPPAYDTLVGVSRVLLHLFALVALYLFLHLQLKLF